MDELSSLVGAFVLQHTASPSQFVSAATKAAGKPEASAKAQKPKAAAAASTPAPAPAPKPAPAPAATAPADAKPEEVEDPATHHKLMAKLTAAGVAFRTLTHGPTRTSEESAAVRGVPLASGAKAMLVRSSEGDGFYALMVMSAPCKLDWKKARKALGVSSLSLASDVPAVTGCLPGAVPPFGSLWGFKTYVDRSVITQGEVINFNAGLRTFSVLGLAVADYMALEAGATVADFTSA